MEKPPSRVGPIAAVGSVAVIAAAQTKPEDAISNIAGWLQLVGIDQVPPFLASAQADAWGTVIGLTALAASLLWWWWDKRRNRPATINDWLRSLGRASPQPAAQHPYWTADKYSEEWGYHAHGKPMQRDTPLSEALAFIVTREWGRSFSQSLAEMFQENARNPFDELRQAAHEGRVTVWGRIHPDTLFRKIPAEHWDEHQVDGKALLMNEYARTWGSDTTSYGHLMVSRAEIEKEWPHG